MTDNRHTISGELKMNAIVDTKQNDESQTPVFSSDKNVTYTPLSTTFYWLLQQCSVM